jgi:hypothetical protein
MAVADTIDAYVAELPGSTRRLGEAQWGITVAADDAGGYPLDIGLRIVDGLLRAQALVAPHDEMLDPWLFLHWNRQTRMVRFACARNGDIWIHGDVPVGSVDAREVDRLLGLVAEGAGVGRRYAYEAMAARPSAN